MDDSLVYSALSLILNVSPMVDDALLPGHYMWSLKEKMISDGQKILPTNDPKQ